MTTKTCSKCGKEKPADEFYKNKLSKDGYEWRCKECVKAATRRREQENPEGVLRSRLSMYGKKPTRRNACRVVEAALNAGVLEKPHNCSICNCPDTEKRIEAHHFDYSRPLDVTWLCPSCHYMADRQRRLRDNRPADPTAKPVVMSDGRHDICRFDSIADAARAIRRSESSLKQCLNGISKSCGGFAWRYERVS